MADSDLTRPIDEHLLHARMEPTAVLQVGDTQVTHLGQMLRIDVDPHLNRVTFRLEDQEVAVASHHVPTGPPAPVATREGFVDRGAQSRPKGLAVGRPPIDDPLILPLEALRVRLPHGPLLSCASAGSVERVASTTALGRRDAEPCGTVPAPFARLASRIAPNRPAISAR